MSQDNEEEVVEGEEAVETDKSSASPQSLPGSQSEADKALTEAEEKDIETAESADDAFKRLQQEGSWAAEVKDKNFGKSTYQPPEPPSIGALHDRGNKGTTTSS